MPLTVLAGEHPRYADLLFSCPAAAVALVARRGPPAARGEALHLLRRGAPLLETLAALELPLWMKKLPPEAFLTAPPDPIPGDGGSCGGADRPEERRDADLGEDGAAYDPKGDDAFGRHALSFAPRHDWRGWLDAALAARTLCGDDFATWLLARRLRWRGCRAPGRVLAPAALFAWYSDHEETPAGALLPRLWTRDFALLATLRQAQRWLVSLCFETAGPPEASLWRRPRSVNGFRFKLLHGQDAFLTEGTAMRNCMPRYAEPAALGRCRIYSIRRNGRSVADLELLPGPAPSDPPQLHQLLGPRNAKPSEPVVAAAKAWLAELWEEIQAQPGGAAADPLFEPVDRAAWRRLFEPYLAARPEARALVRHTVTDPREAMSAVLSMSGLMRRSSAREPRL